MDLILTLLGLLLVELSAIFLGYSIGKDYTTDKFMKILYQLEEKDCIRIEVEHEEDS